MSALTKTTITLADFGTGVIVGLAHEGYKEISVRGLDERMVAAFEWLEKEADKENLELRFRISLNEIYADAPEARKAIKGASSRGLLFADNDHSLFIRVDKDGSEEYLKRLPGTPELWVGAARIIAEF